MNKPRPMRGAVGGNLIGLRENEEADFSTSENRPQRAILLRSK